MLSAADATDACGQPAPPSRSRRGRWRRVAAIILLVLLALIPCLWLVLYVTKGRFLQPSFEATAGALLHRRVSIASGFTLYFDPIDIHLTGAGVHVANLAWAAQPDLFTAKSLDARIEPLSLLFGRRRLRSLTVDQGAIDAEWNADHSANTWTFDPSAHAKGIPLPLIEQANLSGSTVRFRDPRLQLTSDLWLQTIRSTHARIGSALQLVGTGQLRATPFTLTGALLTPDATLARGRNTLTLHIRGGRNRVDVGGTLPTLADIEDVPFAVRAQGKEIDELLAIIGVVVPETRSYLLQATLVKSGLDYRFTHLRGSFGNSDIAGGFTVHDDPRRVRIDADLVTRSLDIIDAAPFIGYSPDTVASKGTLAAARETGAAPAHILPNGSIPVQTMRNFDATLHYRIGAMRSRHVPMTQIDLNLALQDGVLSFKPLTLDVADGHMIANVTVDTHRDPVTAHYDLQLGTTPLGRLLAGFGTVHSGATGSVHGRVLLDGVGETLHDSLASAHGRIAIIMPQGSLSQRDVQLSELDLGVFAQRLLQHKLDQPVQVNCGLLAFTVQHGIAAADPILIDTRNSVITGRGNFNFGSEALDFTLKADSKRLSLFSGQGPIGVDGHFASPAIKVISPDLIARAGVGVGLGLVATPVAGMLAFVDMGGAKAAACGPVLSGATAAAQRTTKGKLRSDVGPGTPSGHVGRNKFLGLF